MRLVTRGTIELTTGTSRLVTRGIIELTKGTMRLGTRGTIELTTCTIRLVTRSTIEPTRGTMCCIHVYLLYGRLIPPHCDPKVIWYPVDKYETHRHNRLMYIHILWLCFWSE
jgi:hypothetical protein